MKIHINEKDLRAYLKRKRFPESIFNEITALDRGDEKVRLADVNPGEFFYFGGYDWVKLDTLSDLTGIETSLCLTKGIVREKAFDEGNCNDWRKSTLRKWLNDDGSDSNDGFLYQLIENEGKGATLYKITSDLTADDGMRDYGFSEDYIALLSCDLYRKYRDVIPPVDDWYWTLTPWTCSAGNSISVRVVYSDGALSHYSAYYGNRGLRPLCNLSSEIFVSVID